MYMYVYQKWIVMFCAFHTTFHFLTSLLVVMHSTERCFVDRKVLAIGVIVVILIIVTTGYYSWSKGQ